MFSVFVFLNLSVFCFYGFFICEIAKKEKKNIQTKKNITKASVAPKFKAWFKDEKKNLILNKNSNEVRNRSLQSLLLAAVMFDNFMPAKNCKGIHRDIIYNTLINSGLNPLSEEGFF